MKHRFGILSVGFVLLISCQQSKENKSEKDSVSRQDSIVEIEKTIIIDKNATRQAKLFAGILPEDTSAGWGRIVSMPAVKTHLKESQKGWDTLEAKYLSKFRRWRDSEIADLNKAGNNLFYPFSGPDFMNAYTFFPNCDNYVMFGLELAGHMDKDLDEKPENYIGAYLNDIRYALKDMYARSYFITSYMGSALYRRSQGVLPILATFVAKTGNQIVGMHRFYVDNEGKVTLKDQVYERKQDTVFSGLAIEFKNPQRKSTQWIYYFGTDVEDSKLAKKPGLVKFIKSFPNKIAYFKAASYVLFNPNFETVKDIVLNDTKAVFQDDTGVPYRDYVANKDKWNIKLYGQYARPVRDFGSYTYQPDLKEAFAKDYSGTIKKLDFPYGYHFRTANASIIVARKK